MPTQQEIRSWVRAETLVESTMLSDADLNAIINQGIRDISTRYDWPYLATDGTIAFVANQQAYTLPANFDRAMAVLVDGTGVRLKEVDASTYWAAYGDTPPSGTPQAFFIWSDKINVIPVPTASTGGLVLYYFRQPTLLTDNSHTPEWASQFHMVVADYACQRVYHREEDFSRAKTYGEAYLDGVERMARYYIMRAKDSPFIMGEGLSHRYPHDGFRFPFFP